MNSINDLLLLEEKAKQIKEEAQAYYEATVFEIEQGKSAILKEKTQRAQNHIAKVRTTEAEVVEENIATIQKDYAVWLEQLEENFAAGQQVWEDTLYSLCIGGDTNGVR